MFHLSTRVCFVHCDPCAGPAGCCASCRSVPFKVFGSLWHAALYAVVVLSRQLT